MTAAIVEHLATNEDRRKYADRILNQCWGCEYWSREEQLFAMAEGWSLNVFAEEEARQDRMHAILVPSAYQVFSTSLEAVAYVLKRAEEGSPLHCRALVLHMASVLKYGQ